ncbi:hypothetical protein Tco_0991250 [Tanacetum coccineum]|uniref:FRIGIDA-like protein n=1 Tax=Tanacetum coccineum TaxID=301880 RepID=A0ABQ5EYQ6_9ASTR
MSYLDKSSNAISDLYKGLNIITKLLKEINNDVKDDLVVNKKISVATKTFTTISTNITEVLSLVKGFDLSNLQSTVRDLQAHVLKQEVEFTSWTKSSPNMAWNLGSRLIGQSSSTPSSSVTPTLTLTHIPTNVEGDNETNTTTEDPSSHTKGETDANKQEKKLVKSLFIVRPDPDALILIPYTINGKLFHLTAEQIQAHLDKEEKIKKAKEEAIKKNTVVKYLMNSLSQMYERIKKIPKELGIPSALPTPISEQAASKSSRRKRKQMKLEQEIKIPGLECHRTHPENIPFVNNMVIKELEYGIFFSDEFGDQAFQRWSDINKVGMEALVSYLVAAFMVQSPKNARFSMKLKKLIAEHPDQEKLKSKKVKLEALGYEMD